MSKRIESIPERAMEKLSKDKLACLYNQIYNNILKISGEPLGKDTQNNKDRKKLANKAVLKIIKSCNIINKYDTATVSKIITWLSKDLVLFTNYQLDLIIRNYEY